MCNDYKIAKITGYIVEKKIAEDIDGGIIGIMFNEQYRQNVFSASRKLYLVMLYYIFFSEILFQYPQDF